jgi:apolipoprotein N-acyltransferase
MKKRYLFLMALLSGLLLSLAWPADGFPFLLFIAFVPLLYVEDFIAKNKHNFIKASVFFYAFAAFFVWNAFTTWWIYYSTTFGVIMAVVFNSLFMATVFHLYHLVRRTVFKSKGAFNVLILFWITFEYLHLDWDLTWSWLNLGNGFAAYPKFVQWYEITGVFGGDVWVLLANILMYKLLLNAFGLYKSRSNTYLFSVSFVLLIVIPMAISFYLYFGYQEKPDPYTCVVVQPNIDPYNEKFEGMSETAQLDKMLGLAKQKVNNTTDFLIFPETALPSGMDEDEINHNSDIDSLKLLIRKFPRLKIVIGVSSYKVFKTGEKLSATAQYSKAGDYYYDVCNTALYLDSTFKPQLYHKSKLVPGVEMMPFPRLLKPLGKFALDLGGMTGSNATQKERTALGPKNGTIKIAPVICYESIYGDFLTGYMRNGANLIFIITNDGWWENTAGHRQHFQYARLRAIENRRSIARSANTGISGFINQRGDIIQASKYWTPDVMEYSLNANSYKTFYSRFGDYIGKICFWLTVVMLLIQVNVIILNKRKRIITAKKKSQTETLQKA